MGVRGCREAAGVGSAGGGRRRAAGSCGMSMAEPRELQQQRKPGLGLEWGSWLAQRGSTKRWPWEEGEDGIEICTGRG